MKIANLAGATKFQNCHLYPVRGEIGFGSREGNRKLFSRLSRAPGERRTIELGDIS
jgi:hypothetical protein